MNSAPGAKPEMPLVGTPVVAVELSPGWVGKPSMWPRPLTNRSLSTAESTSNLLMAMSHRPAYNRRMGRKKLDEEQKRQHLCDAQQRYRQSAKYRATVKARLARPDVQKRAREAVRRWQRSDKGKTWRLAYQRQYIKTEAHKEKVERYRRNGKLAEWQHRYLASERGRRKRKALFLTTVKETPAYYARLAVRYAVAKGYLPHIRTLFCACGKMAAHYHHHLGYKKKHWLHVLPVCVRCHSAADHAQL